ncbi:MAG TPA: ATP-dependent Clp protease proteolytic subunit [Candidatus Obscuribacterales bacterium]
MPNSKSEQKELRKKMGKKEDRAEQHEYRDDDDDDSPKNRRVYLFGRLENEIALPVIKRILKLNDRNSRKPIDLIINSAGGNGYNADAIIATMSQISAPVNTICTGHALSGACEVLASGTGKRMAYEYATLMFHQTLWEADGDITNLEIQARQGQRFRDAQIELLSRCTGKDEKTIRKDIERDFYMSSREALEYGIIDEVIRLRRVDGASSHNTLVKPAAARKKAAAYRR